MNNQLNFYKTDSREIVADYLYQRISKQLAGGQKVLWLLSGGSAISVAVKTAKLFENTPAEGLIVSLVDERFGPVGHTDSNWEQLLGRGFSVAGAKLHPVLSGGGLKETASAYDKFIKEAVGSYGYRIALLGIGDDGHTAGILPDSPAVGSNDMVSAYRGPDYQRITFTPNGIAALDEVVVFAQGESKRAALGGLAKPLSIAEQPAQVIKRVPLANVYSNLIGEKI